MTKLTETVCQATTEAALAPAEPAWYCVRSHLKHEHIAAAHLAQIPEIEVFNPQLRVLRATRRGRVWSTESLFPNYLFARFALESKLEKVRYTPSVAAVLHFGTTVLPIADAVITDLQRDVEQLKSKVLTEAPEEGEEVEVASGAFKGLTGVVVNVLPARERVQILLDFMGRSTVAELSLEMLMFRRRAPASLLVAPAQAPSGRPRKGPGPARSLPAWPSDPREAAVQSLAC